MQTTGRRIFLAALTFGIVVTPLAAEAQPTGNVYRIGLLLNRDKPEKLPGFDALPSALRALGYAEKQNIAMVVRGSDRYERLPQLAVELVQMKPDVIVAYSPQTALAAKKATQTIPIVFLSVSDPLSHGLVRSLAHPDGNVTGVSWLGDALTIKTLEMLKEALPRVSRVAILSNRLNPSHPRQLNLIKGAEGALRLSVLSIEVRGPDHLQEALAALSRERVGAIAALPDGMLSERRAVILDFAARSRVPVVYTFSSWVDDGALMSYGTNFGDQWRRVAGYIDKILKGAKPADLPVEQPTTFELVINLRTAKALGLTIPQSLLLRADQLIR